MSLKILRNVENIAGHIVDVAMPTERHRGVQLFLHDLQSFGHSGLTHRAKAMPPELSGGERQRAALARAIIMSPDVIIADEPTGNVDWEMSERLLTLLVELNKLGKTVVIATHDLSLIRSAKSQVQARILRISNKQLQLAGANL